MKVSAIRSCANHECPNKPNEGTFTVTTIQTAENAPRNITLALCGACASYLEDARVALDQAAFMRGRQETKQAMYAAMYGGRVAPGTNNYVFVGGPLDGSHHRVPDTHNEWRVARTPNTSYIGEPYARPSSSTRMHIDTYYKCYRRRNGKVIAFVHEAQIENNSLWVRV